MKDRKITAFLMLLALAVACFISASAFSGEHPWDSEGKGGSGSTGGISGGGLLPPTNPLDSTAASITAVGGARPAMDVWSRMVFEVSYRVVRMLYGTPAHQDQVAPSDWHRTRSH